MLVEGHHSWKKRCVATCGTLTSKRMKGIFVFTILLSTFFLFLNVKKSSDIRYLRYLCTYINVTDSDCYESNTNEEKFTIQTEGCSIPFLKPLDHKIREFFKNPEVPRCFNESSVVTYNKTHIWIKENQSLAENKEKISCCYRSFYRPVSVDNINKKVDERVKYDDCVNFNDVINVQHEFVKINCSVENRVIEEYFLFAQKKKFNAHNDQDEISGNATAAYNILVLGIDSVSRLNFFRTMPKTVKYLLENDALDLAGYNKVADNTFPNLIPMLLGISDTEIKMTCWPHKDAKFDNCPFIWEWYKQAGYYTAFAEDSSWLGTFNYNRPGFSISPTDYYIHTFINEAEKYATKENFRKSIATCLNNKYFYQVLLDYIEDITETIRDKKLFGLFWETTVSHDDLNSPMIMDDDYLKFFQNMKMSGYLDSSIVFVLSDHGMRWGDIRYTKQGRLEERLPFVFILLPRSFREKYIKAYKNLKLNTKRLTSPYDIFSTLYDLTNLENIKNENIIRRRKQRYHSNRSISLFLPIPSNRTCELAGISDHWCTCYKRTVKSKNNRLVWRAAAALVESMNARLSAYKECATLSLSNVIEANEMVVGKRENEEVDSWRELMVVIKTTPGDGVFEATLRGGNGLGWTIVGTVSRLNLYGNQSDCITDNLLKLYCYCQ